jgi:hypothetical protein
MFIACNPANQSTAPQEPNQLKLVEQDGLYANSPGSVQTIPFSVTTDTGFNGDSLQITLSPTADTLLFTFLSFNDNVSNKAFFVDSTKLVSQNGRTLIRMDCTYSISDAIVVLQYQRSYSFNARIIFPNRLPAGQYHFVANVTEACFCLTLPRYNLQGGFFVN